MDAYFVRSRPTRGSARSDAARTSPRRDEAGCATTVFGVRRDPGSSSIAKRWRYSSEAMNLPWRAVAAPCIIPTVDLLSAWPERVSEARHESCCEVAGVGDDSAAAAGGFDGVGRRRPSSGPSRSLV